MANTVPTPSPTPPRRKLSRARSYLPLLTSGILVVLFALYYYFYVAAQKGYFDQRAFRVLSVMGDKLAGQVEGIRGTFAASTASPSPSVRDYLFDNLEWIGARKEAIQVAQGYSDGVQHREGAFFLQALAGTNGFQFMAKYHDPPGSSLAPPECPLPGASLTPSQQFLACARIELQDHLRTIFDSLNEGLFDDILIADRAGRVFYQHSHAGERIADFNFLLDPAGLSAPTGKTSQTTEAPQAGGDPLGTAGKRTVPMPFERASAYANVADVKLGGASYHLYLQPLTQRIYEKDGSSTTVVLCGVRSAARAQAQSLAMPYTYVIWATLALLAVMLLGWPVLKIFFVSPKERLRLAHVLFLIFSTLLATVLLTLIALNLSYKQHDAEEADWQLRQLAKSIQANVHEELGAALNLVDATSDPDYFRYLQRRPGDKHWNPLTDALGSCGDNRQPTPPDGSCKALDLYPYFHYLFWADDKGLQQFKVTIDKRSTTRTSIADENYFTEPLGGNNLSVLPNPRIPGGFYKFFMAPTFSPNTGEFFVVVSTPYQGGKVLSPEGKDLHLKVGAIAARFESLFQTVLPDGFGYAVVDETGKVQFHSTAIRNLIEDFFRETRGTPALNSLLAEGLEGTIVANYLGKRQMLHILPLIEFQHPHWFLVTFRDWEDYTTVNLSVILVFGLLVLAYVLCLSVIAWIYVAQQRAYPLEAVWPCNELSPELPSGKQLPNYFHIVLTNVFLTASYLTVYNHLPNLGLFLAMLLICLMGILYPFVRGEAPASLVTFLWKIPTIALCYEFVQAGGLASWLLLMPVGFLVVSIPSIAESLEPRVKQRIPLRFQYTTVAVSLLMVLVVAPCCGFFKMAYESIHRLSLERQQLALVRNLDARKQRVYDYYQERVAPGIADKRINSRLDRYDFAFLNADLAFPAPPHILAGPAMWERFVSRLGFLLPGNQFAADLRELARRDKSLYQWWLQAGAEQKSGAIVTALRIEPTGNPPSPDPQIASALPTWQGLDTWGSLALFGVAVLLFLWIFFVTKRVFLMEQQNVPPLDLWKPSDEVDNNLIVIGHPKSGKRKAVTAVRSAESLDLADRATTGDWSLIRPVAPIVILEHFEFGIDDPNLNGRKLQLLEELLHVHRVWVIVLSAVDPMFYLVAGSGEILQDGAADLPSTMRLLDRWAGVLSKFRKVRIEDTSVEKFQRSLARRRRNYPSRFSGLINWVEEECDHTAFLRVVIAKRILRAHRVRRRMSLEDLVSALLDPSARRYSLEMLAERLYASDVHITSREDLLAALREPGAPSRRRLEDLLQDALLDMSDEQRVQEVVYRADSYYRVLWASCTKDERLVLFQLAEDGWVNPKNGRAIQQLQRKELVRRPAGFRVMNESFRRFIRANQYPEEIAEWEQEGARSVWGAVRLSLIISSILLVSWLFYAQQPDTGTMIGYLGAAGAGVSALYKLVSEMRGGGSGGAPAGAQSA